MMQTKLTNEAAELLLTVRRVSGGAWVKRRDLAAAMDKKRLNAADIALLDILAIQGYIQSREVKNATPIGYEFEYKSKTDET